MQMKNNEIQELKTEMSELKLMTLKYWKNIIKNVSNNETLEVLRTSYNDLVDELKD